MTPDDLPTAAELSEAEYRITIGYVLDDGTHVTRLNVRLVAVHWLRCGLLLEIDLGNGWRPMPYRWDELLRCEWAGVRA